MRAYIKNTILLLGCAAALAACAHHGSPPPTPLGFTRYQPIYMDVAVIETTDEYKSPMLPPNVEHLMPYSPAEAMHIWANDRLRAVGLNKTLQIIIKNASVIATELPPSQGVEGMVEARDRRYDAVLDVEMRIYGDSPMSLASIRVKATRSGTLSEKAGVGTRDAFFRHMIFAMMEDMNAQLEKNIFKYFGNYISYSHSP